jgi:hypothetical protein
MSSHLKYVLLLLMMSGCSSILGSETPAHVVDDARVSINQTAYALPADAPIRHVAPSGKEDAVSALGEESQRVPLRHSHEHYEVEHIRRAVSTAASVPSDTSTHRNHIVESSLVLGPLKGFDPTGSHRLGGFDPSRNTN